MTYSRSTSCLISRCALGIGAAVLCIGGLFVPVASFFHRPSFKAESSSLLEAVKDETHFVVKSIPGPLPVEPPEALQYAGQMSSTLFPACPLVATSASGSSDDYGAGADGPVCKRGKEKKDNPFVEVRGNIGSADSAGPIFPRFDRAVLESAKSQLSASSQELLTALSPPGDDPGGLSDFSFPYFEPEFVEVSPGYQMCKALSATVEAKFWILENKVTRKPGKAAIGDPPAWFTNADGAKDYANDPWGKANGFNRVQSFTPKSKPTPKKVKLFNLMNIENLALLTTTILAKALTEGTPEAFAQADKDLMVMQITTGFGASWADQLSLAWEGQPVLLQKYLGLRDVAGLEGALAEYLFHRERCDDLTKTPRAHDSFCSPAPMRERRVVKLAVGMLDGPLEFDKRTGLIHATPRLERMGMGDDYGDAPVWPGDAKKQHLQIVSFRPTGSDLSWTPFKILGQDPRYPQIWKYNFDPMMKKFMKGEDSGGGVGKIFSANEIVSVDAASSGLELLVAHADEVQVFTGTDFPQDGSPSSPGTVCREALYELAQTQKAKGSSWTNLDLLKKTDSTLRAREHFCTLWGPRKWDLNRWSLHPFDKELIDIIVRNLQPEYQYAGYC